MAELIVDWQMSGIVRLSGQPQVGATILLVDTTNNRIVGNSTTDAEGRYTIKRLVEGRPYLLTGHIGDSRVIPKIRIPFEGTLEVVRIYYGWLDSYGIPELDDILTKDYVHIVPGDPIQIPFHTNTEFKYLWFAEPSTEPIKTNWDGQDNALNAGGIGGDSNLFGDPYQLEGFRFNITNYQSIAYLPMKFTSGGEVPNIREPI